MNGWVDEEMSGLGLIGGWVLDEWLSWIYGFG